MAPKKMLRIVLNERPADAIVPGRTFRQEIVDAPSEAHLKDGQALFETYYVSIDPTNRGWIHDGRSYMPPVQIGEVMRAVVVGKILASRNPTLQSGSWVAALAGWSEYAVLNPQQILISKRYPGTKVVDLGGIFCTTGLTAYFGVRDIAEPVKPGELAVVSGAAGATGSVVGQILKMKGARVVGIAGSADKCRWLTEDLGFDVALNYKDANFEEQFLEATKSFIDIYWDNVGGKILDLALGQANKNARFVMCGSIANTNKRGDAQTFRNIGKVVSMRIRMQGFIVTDFVSEFDHGAEQLSKWVTEGHIKIRNHIIKGGLKEAEQALHDLFEGVNTGKLFVEVKIPEDSE